MSNRKSLTLIGGGMALVVFALMMRGDAAPKAEAKPRTVAAATDYAPEYYERYRLVPQAARSQHSLREIDFDDVHGER